MKLREWNAHLHGLVVFRALLNDPVVAKLLDLTDRMEAGCSSYGPVCDAVAAFEAALFEYTTNWGSYLSAAVLEAEQPETLHRALEFLQDLDNYQRIVDTYGYGQQRLQETLGLDDEAICELDGYMDFEKYGTDCMENDSVIETEFGRLRRLEPPFPEQTQGQQMFQ